MAKTTSLFVRVEPEVKEQAESILEQLGYPCIECNKYFFKTGYNAERNSI